VTINACDCNEKALFIEYPTHQVAAKKGGAMSEMNNINRRYFIKTALSAHYQPAPGNLNLQSRVRT